jgi:signal transduction histidine kinase/CheY-like chemotaxis protein
MLLSMFTDESLREKLDQEEFSNQKLVFFLYSCFATSFTFMIIAFFLFESRKDLSSPYFMAAIASLILPFTLKLLGQARYSLIAFPILLQITLTQFAFITPKLQSIHFMWFFLIPYFSIRLTSKSNGIRLSILALATVTTAKSINLINDYSEKSLQQTIYFVLPYCFITYLCWNFHIKNEQAKKLNREKKEIAGESQKNKDTFWGNISHEIRTPLNGILGMAHLLKESQLKDEQQELLNIIKDSAENLNIVLSDIIDYSKLEMNKIVINKQVFHLASFLDQIISLFQHLAQKKKVHLTYIIDPDVPAGLYADTERIKQILINLVSNALKFTESGSVKIIVERFDRKESFRFSVEDTGIGIPEDKRDKLFSPFTQIDSKNTRQYGGSGLGLVICSKLTHLLGGQIEVESQVGHGSIFSLTLTAIPAKVLPQQEQKQEHEVTSHLHHMTKKVSLNVLVVEDNPINQKLLVALLNKNGYRPHVANDGLEAVQAFKENFYHLVFMDIQMPRMDGITATKKILEQNLDCPPKIVAVTANALQQDREKCFRAGMDDFLTKPINNDLLKSILNRYREQVVDIDEVVRRPLDDIDPKKSDDFQAVEYSSFNAQKLLEHYDNDMGVIYDLYLLFKAYYTKGLKQLSQAVHDQDSAELSATAHSMKGTLMSLQCYSGKVILEEREDFSKAQDFEKSLEAITHLVSLCEKLMEELDHFTSLKVST